MKCTFRKTNNLNICDKTSIKAFTAYYLVNGLPYGFTQKLCIIFNKKQKSKM